MAQDNTENKIKADTFIHLTFIQLPFFKWSCIYQMVWMYHKPKKQVNSLCYNHQVCLEDLFFQEPLLQPCTKNTMIPRSNVDFCHFRVKVNIFFILVGNDLLKH